MKDKFKFWLKSVFHQLVEINDTPYRKAVGFGLGVFLGTFPGMGPIASLVGAYVFRLNRAAALAGSVLTNTWFTFLTMAWAVKFGAGIRNMDAGRIELIWTDLSHDFHWAKLNDPEIVNTLLAILAGFFMISFCAGILSAGIVFFSFNTLSEA